jgi:hypothetical protein
MLEPTAQRRILQHAASLRRLRPERPRLGNLVGGETVCASPAAPATCSRSIAFAVRRPRRVSLNKILVRPTGQGL